MEKTYLVLSKKQIKQILANLPRDESCIVINSNVSENKQLISYDGSKQLVNNHAVICASGFKLKL